MLASVPKAPPVFEWIPGVLSPPSRNVIDAAHCLLMGRSEDFHLKGLDIAAKALARASHNKLKNAGIRVALVVRGAPKGTGVELKKKLNEACGDQEIPIRVREYSSAVGTIEADLKEASLLIMPSRSEGFGLVVTEAISMGRQFLSAIRAG